MKEYKEIKENCGSCKYYKYKKCAWGKRKRKKDDICDIGFYNNNGKEEKCKINKKP